MKTITKNYYNYELEYFMQPGKEMTEVEMNGLRNTMISIVALAGKNLNYGIFEPNLTAEQIKDFLSSANICIIRDNGEAIGFNCNIVIRETSTPIIHAGLVVIAKNRGHNLMTFCYLWMGILQFKKFGSHYYTNISSTPSILGSFADSVSDVWPSYKANQLKPPTKDYVAVLESLNQGYIQKYFKADQCVVDKKRFVLQSPSTEMGFETNMKKLSRYSKPEANYFCMFWLDYSKGEDLIQVGRITWKTFALMTLAISYESMGSLSEQYQTMPKQISQKVA